MPKAPLTEEQIQALQQLIFAIVLHHTAGTYKAIYDHYHFCITWDGFKARAIQTRSLRERGSHTWKRNTGRIGISLCGAFTGYPIRKEQLEVMAKLIAELCIRFRIELDGFHDAQDLYNTVVTHKVPNVTDHVFYGKMDKYGKPDIGEHLKSVLHKAHWYYGKLKSGEQKFEHTKGMF